MEPPTPHPPIGQVPSAVPPPRAGTATVPPPHLPAPAVPAPPARRRLWPVLAIAVSTIALLLAAGAGLVSWRALDQANDARDIALRGGPGPAPAPSSEPGASTGQEPQPTAGPAGEVGEPPAVDPTTGEASDEIPINPTAQYTLVYEKQQLKIQARCNYPTYADLDKPEVRVSEAVADLGVFRTCSTGGVAVFQIDTPAASVSDGSLATLSATDCVDRIRTGPIADGAEVPIKQGNLLCLVTSASRAVTEGISRKVVALEVVGVVDEQGTSTATVNVTTWNIPR